MIRIMINKAKKIWSTVIIIGLKINRGIETAVVLYFDLEFADKTWNIK
jgi:hypothetical protein